MSIQPHLGVTKKISLIHNYLVFQLFFYFSITFIGTLFITYSAFNLDDRRLSSLNEKDTSFLEYEIAKLKKRYDIDEIFEQDSIIQSPSGLSLVLVDKYTNVVSGMDQTNLKPLLTFLYQTEGNESPMARSFEGQRINGPFPLQTTNREYNAYFLYPVQEQQDWLNTIFDNPTIIIGLHIIFILPIIFFVSWRITRPLKELRVTANSVARGSLVINTNIENKGIKEFQDVGRSLNYMIGSLQSLRDHQQRLLSDISHELKTPLARLQLATAILKRKYGETKETERVEGEIEKMNTMVLDLLSLSRQQINQHLERDIFSIDKIWHNVLEDASFETEQNGIMLIVENNIRHPEHFFINGNLQTLSSSIENVIRNAQKYAQSKIKVKISLENENENENENEGLVITVEDDGPGVPDSELDKIFRPFYRVDEARARQTGGTGLGLTIVFNAIQQHKGSVVAMRGKQLGGLKVKIRLPLWFE